MNHFEDSLKKELDALPYTKHLDDGGYNDGQIVGFELGARWCMSKILSQKGNFIKEIEQRIKDEHRKYKNVPDWERIAAVKIYIGLFEDSVERVELNKVELTPDQVEDYLKNIE